MTRRRITVQRKIKFSVKNRKNQNSILFLTTLGVYLGLVLVSGTPQVLAHAAMTRNFEITDEIEVKDDLDKKPDDERSPLSDSIQVYFQDVEYFLSSLQNLNQNGKFNIEFDTFEVAQSTLLPCVAGNKVGSYTASKFSLVNEFLRPSLESFSKRLTDGYSLADCLPSERFSGQEVTASRFNLKLDRSEFSVEIAVKKRSPQTASQFLSPLAQASRAFNSNEKELIRAKLIENTSFKSKNNQVFIVTRLPRAGLDSLLAKDAK